MCTYTYGTLNKNKKNVENYKEKAVIISGGGVGVQGRGVDGVGMADGWAARVMLFCSRFTSCYLLSLISHLVITLYFSAVLAELTVI